MRNRFFFALPILMGVSIALQAQSTQTPNTKEQSTGSTSSQSPTTGHTTIGQPPTGQSSAVPGSPQTFTGVLMDASCPVIASSAADRSTATSAGVNTYSASRRSATGTATGTRTTGERDASASTNSGSTDYAPARSTTEATAQAARDISATAQTATTGNPTAGGATAGERSRSAFGDPATSSSFTTVREKYRDCMVTPTTTAFAIHSEGRLIVLAETGNQAVRQRLTSDQFRNAMTDAGGNPKWMSVTLNGSMQGEQLIVTSVQRK